MQMQRRQVVLQLNKFCHWQIYFPIPPNTKHKPPNTHVILVIAFPISPKYQRQTPKYTYDIGNYISHFPQIPKTKPQINYTCQSKDYNERKLSDIEFIWTNVATHSLSGGLD